MQSAATQSTSTSLIGALALVLVQAANAGDLNTLDFANRSTDLIYRNGFETPAGSTADVLCPFSGTYTGTYSSAGTLTANLS
jgi:hypothetical protein